MTMTELTETTAEPTEATPEEALAASIAAVAELESDLAALPNQYAQATKRGNADVLKEIRHRRLDCESELVAARVRLIHAEIGALHATQAAARLTEAEIAREGQEAESALLSARAGFDEAAATSNTVEGRASALRWEVQNTRKQILLAEDRLNALISAPMPD